MDIGEGAVFAIAVDVDYLAVAVILFQAAAFACGNKVCDGMGWLLPVEADVACACETGVFESVIAEDGVKLVCNAFCGGVAVPIHPALLVKLQWSPNEIAVWLHNL